MVVDFITQWRAGGKGVVGQLVRVWVAAVSDDLSSNPSIKQKFIETKVTSI